ncbi:2-hydroxyacid dehydrogenase [Roseiconus nitratireducens]|uniref:2-hydroxyacid dehydrogenase n=1 Tax=Roseiconus nitratireducens TaxID=2605748 RepID=A0A5M6CWQ5_9BACT|nr:2-hydroxyacid dehydrogenase [Roseiconus nitratireducens]KAA5538820.1 2-hydroxyacid dehydrogenase [Roseiconus nitratireducens]
MKVAFFSVKSYDESSFEAANREFPHQIRFFETRLTLDTVAVADGCQAVCVFVNDVVDRDVLKALKERGVSIIALRCAGFNNVDLHAASELSMRVVRVPEYSPHAVAEHAVALLLALNRHLHRAYNRVRNGDFRLAGLLGFDLHGRTVGVVGTGKIGCCVCRILQGFGCQVLASDPHQNPECVEMGVRYVSNDELFRQSSVIMLQCPLVPQTHHLIDADAIEKMPWGVMLINTSRGAVIDTGAVIEGLKSGKVGSLGIDVYEEEAALFFEDLSTQVITDDVFARLLTFPNVLITGHQAFFTAEALKTIAEVTLRNLSDLESGEECDNEVTVES